MKYNISVKEFMDESKNGSINYADFCSAVTEKTSALNETYNFFQFVANFRQRAAAEVPLYGLPVSVKDCICVKGMQSSAGSKILQGYMPPFDATAVARIKESGARVLGKTNQDEFGFGTFSTNSAYGVPKNPYDPQRSCGGSSGGAAGITAALKMPHIALAESTGGSISCPAAFCGVVGLTPTYGLVSRYGLIDYANSLDKIGVMARCVHDAALLLSHIGGHDSMDSTSLNTKKQDYTKSAAKKDLKGLRIGVPKEYFDGVDPKIIRQVESAIEKLESLGAKSVKISLPMTRYALAAYYIIATAEASTNLSKYCGMRYGLHLDIEGNFSDYFSKVRSAGFGLEAKRRIILGTFARMSGYRDAYYLKAMKVRTMIIDDFKKAFKKCDVLAAPTMPILPPKFSDIAKLTPLENYRMDVLTVPSNVAGIPQLSINCGFISSLPVGLHLMADHLQESKLIETAAAFEAAARDGKK
ncbi:MAG: Asp-tRNA(Asn)/Glu-tRNA(Gln) amidotransferase subunit GatA [Candidatus Aenigmarchaeota archaeon]|nr:Asp-tRNA(Asn)/Glu-tRNA(Gln) amidotransferase subunit GatA [Candidatus Aenigmarchaeota archaeon]